MDKGPRVQITQMTLDLLAALFTTIHALNNCRKCKIKI